MDETEIGYTPTKSNPMITGTTGHQKSIFCKTCGRRTRHESDAFVTCGLMSLLSCGLLLPIAIPVYLFGKNYVCQICGRKAWR